MDVTIAWKPTNSTPIRSIINGGEIEMKTGNGSWWYDVAIEITGRTTTKAPTGDYGTRAKMTFPNGDRVACWVL